MTSLSSSASPRSGTRTAVLTILPIILAIGSFLALGAYQLHLPGLHYDEAKEAGLNAMQLLTGRPVTAFREAAVQLGRWQLPLMVQDYIGALNVYLAVPFLAVGGINVVALRWLPLLIGALTLVLTWKIALRLGGPVGAITAASLMAVSPTFIFWSRQGIFVTNIASLIFVACLWCGLQWWAGGGSAYLYATAFFAGLGLYAKLSFAWAIGAMVVVATGAWLLERRKGTGHAARLLALPRRAKLVPVALALFCFAMPLVPLVVFNLETGGTFSSILDNFGRSYYGVDNSAYLPNLATRLTQFVHLLEGDHFWYLGYPFANVLAPWLAAGICLLASGSWLLGRRDLRYGLLLPLCLLVLMVLQSGFTVSDLFITHYAILYPLIPLAGGLALAAVHDRQVGRSTPVARALLALSIVVVAVWGIADAVTTVRYHRVLSISGGYSGHSDAVYDLAQYMDEMGYREPVVLDWGIDAPIRFLTAGRVSPIEVFGYEKITGPDREFSERLLPFFQDDHVVYLAHAQEKTVFRGRVESAQAFAGEKRRLWLQQAWFAQRSGEIVFIVYRSLPFP